ELDAKDPGWRLEDIEAGRVDPPEVKNSARVVADVRRLLPRDWPKKALAEVTDPVYGGSLESPRLLTAGQEAGRSKELQAVDPAVRLARHLAEMDLGRHPLESDNLLTMRLSGQEAASPVAWLLEYDALLLGQKGDVEGALRSARGALNAGRSLYDEP